jgi:hypothetical protein
MDADLALIRKALNALPNQCRYHHDRTEPDSHARGREACCDTGVPAQRRKLAEQALQRLSERGAAPGFVEQHENPALVGTKRQDPDLH